LRHTYASLLIQRADSLAYVKEQLGHSSIQITVDLSGHPVPGANRSAVDRLAEATGRNLAATGEVARGGDREVTSDEDWSRRRDLNPRPADYETTCSVLTAHLPREDLEVSAWIPLCSSSAEAETLPLDPNTREHPATRGD